MLERSGVTKYVFDEDGNFVEKISYSECLFEYFEYADEEVGVYPLTEDLKTIIIERGEYVGWWDVTDEKHGLVFRETNGNPIAGLNEEIAWLFMCAYLE